MKKTCSAKKAMYKMEQNGELSQKGNYHLERKIVVTLFDDDDDDNNKY